MVDVLLAVLPFLAAFQRYCVAYGFAGADRPEAWRQALGVFRVAAILSLGAAAAVALP